jgi:hypothetical protein
MEVTTIVSPVDMFTKTRVLEAKANELLAIAEWRESFDRILELADENRARYEALLDRVNELVVSRNLDLEMADVIAGRRHASAREFETIMNIFDAAESNGLLGSTGCNLVGGCDGYELVDMEIVVEAFETADATGAYSF